MREGWRPQGRGRRFWILSVCGEPIREKTGNREGTCRSWPECRCIRAANGNRICFGKTNSALPISCFFSNGFYRSLRIASPSPFVPQAAISPFQTGVPIPATPPAYNKASPMVPEGICMLKFFVIVAPITAKVSASGSSPPLSMDLE